MKFTPIHLPKKSFLTSCLLFAMLACAFGIGCATRALPPAEPYNSTHIEEIPTENDAPPRASSTPKALRWDTSFYEEGPVAEPSDKNSSLDKQPYETAEDYIKRIADLVSNQQSAILMAERDLDRLSEKKEQTLGKIAHLQEQNDKIIAALVTSGSASRDPGEQDAPCALYIVEKGDTLYGLAKRYYGSGAMATKIQEWNGLWINDPDKITAGMTIALFFDPEEENGEASLKNYLYRFADTRED